MTLHRPLPYTAGDFRFPVTVQRPTYSDDGAGGQITTWTTHLTAILFAVENMRGAEQYGDKDKGRVRTLQSFKFTTWFGYDIVQTDRLSFQGTLYNIRAVNNLKLLNKFLQIEADAGVEQ